MARGYPDFEGGKAGLYLVAEWASFEGTEKTLHATAVDKGYWESTAIEYEVPAGKVFYCSKIACAIVASNAADGDKNQICDMSMGNLTEGVSYTEVGGNGGAIAVHPVPIAFPAGDTFAVTVRNCANHDCNIYISAEGYEI